MKKWNSKNKRRVLISLLFTLIGVGFLGMRSVEPLNAADNEETKQMADSDIAVKYPLKPTFKVSGTEFENWLPSYDKWLNSETKTIPKENAFVMMRSSKTEIIESETSPEIWNNYQNKVLGVINAAGETLDNTVAYPTNKGQQHITFSNVGYYNGESVNVTVSIKPDKAATDDNKHYSYIGLDGKNAAGDDLFLDISLDKLSEAADIDFQFKNSEGEPIEISGYWTFSNINDVKDVVLPISKIKNIYSISREYEQAGEKYPVMLKYEELATSSWGEKALKLSGIRDKLPNQISATVTYDKQSSFKYRMVYKDNSGAGFDVKYIQGSDAKVEIPDPQGLDQSFDIITAENYPKNDQSNEIEKPINYQFIQFVPYESNSENFSNRDQAMCWVLPELNLSGLAENGWKIFNEDGEDVTELGLFTFNPETATITAEIDREELYNHYFTFQVDFRFDDANPVDPNLLDEKYFTIKDEVKLLVDELLPVKTTFQSKINFAAEAEFEPVYRDPDDGDKVKPIPDSSSQTKNDLLITHKYPEITPPPIEGYQYTNESIPENYTELPVRYTKPKANKVQLVYEEQENWLPFYSKWLNSETEIIPKENAFVMRYSEGYQNESGETIGKTEIVGHSEEIDIEQEGDKAGTVVLPFKTSVNEQFLVFSNVGYYQGNQIAVKMSLKPSNLATGTNARYNYVGISSSRLFEVQVDSSVKTVEVTFDFLKQTEGENWESWSEIALSGYWTLSNFKNTKDVIVPADLIDHIYSIDRSYKTDKDELAPIFLKYQEESTDSLVISSVGQNPTQPNATKVCLVSEQELATITYTNSKQFQYTLVPNRVIGASGNPYLPSIAYVSSTYAKVAIPDPQGLTQVFDTITADNYENNEGDIVSPLNYQFIQSIPYESEKNRDQQMEWLLPNDINGSITESIEWKIINESGVDGTKYFTIDGSKIKPTSEAYEDENFYNHYYFFQKNMMINTEEEIDQTILQSKDNEGKYLDYTGNIGLQVTDEGRNIPLVEEPFHSYINFAAEADFEPVYRDSEDGNKVKPIPDSSVQIEKDLLITHNYQEITPPAIDGYEYADESIPENYTELPVRYTQAEDNKVQLVYAESIGELFFDIPEEMNFQKVSIPTVFQKTEYLQAIDPDWAIKVTDERSEKQRTPWKLSAQIADQSFYTHTDSEYQGQKVDSVYEENIPLMSNILRFANADGATNDLTQSVVIYDSGDEPQAYNNYPIQWTEKNTGFFLDLQAYHYYPLGKYKATIDFTVEYVE